MAINLQHVASGDHLHVDIVLRTPSGQELNIGDCLPSDEMARVRACMAGIQNQLAPGEAFEFDLNRLSAETAGGRGALSSDDPHVQQLQQLISKATGIPQQSWRYIPEGHPASSTEGRPMHVIKGDHLNNRKFETEDLSEAVKCNPANSDVILAGYAYASPMRDITEGAFKHTFDEVGKDPAANPKVKKRRQDRIRAAMPTEEKCRDTELLFEATHPLQDHPTKQEFLQKQAQAQAFADKKPAPRSDKQGWTPWTRCVKPEYQEAKKAWVKDAAGVTYNQAAWLDAEDALQGGEKAAGPALYLMHLSRALARGADVEEAVRDPLSKLLIGNLDTVDQETFLLKMIDELTKVKMAVEGQAMPQAAPGKSLTEAQINDYVTGVQKNMSPAPVTAPPTTQAQVTATRQLAP